MTRNSKSYCEYHHCDGNHSSQGNLIKSDSTNSKKYLKMALNNTTNNRLMQEKLEKLIKTIESDLEREKSISLDADLNEKRISKEKEELLKTENELLEVETNSSKELKESKNQLDDLQSKLDAMLDQIEKDIDEDKKLLKETFYDLRQLVKNITSSQEVYAEKFGKDKSIQSDSIKRKERIKNIDLELKSVYLLDYILYHVVLLLPFYLK